MTVKYELSNRWPQSKKLIRNSMNSFEQTSLFEQPFMSDDHSKVVPLLPIPNRTVKRFCADDSAGSRVKVGHRQTITASKAPFANCKRGFGFFDRDVITRGGGTSVVDHLNELIGGSEVQHEVPFQRQRFACRQL